MKNSKGILYLKLFFAFLLGAGASYLGYMKWSSKVVVQHTVCILDATQLALNESERAPLEALGQSSQPASDGKGPLKGFSECQQKVDPGMSDLDFAKKMVLRSKQHQPN